MIPYGRQDISQADINAVVEVLRSDYLTQGPVVPRFEAAVATYCGAEYAVATSSATAALHIACLALGVSIGDIVWTSPISFVASANCALYCGATIDFVDIDFQTNNMSEVELEKKLHEAQKTGSLPKVVIPVHMGGFSCDMKAIHALSIKYDFRIIEDASHAIGASYLGDPVGSCRYSDIAVFSFHPVKIITTAEGGMALTKDAKLNERLNLLRSHGITRDPIQMNQEPDGDWYYQQLELGYNYRMTELQGALGCSQMERLKGFVAKRNRLASQYRSALTALNLSLPQSESCTYSSYHLYIVILNSDDKADRKRVFDYLREHGIGVNVHYIPIHLQPYYRRLGFQEGQFPEAEKFYRSAISIPLHANLTEEEQNFVVARMTEVVV
jgi:UDP-4-amino-4,6-dideoxy-N-acetyl-beta-L-altrosamine transaminase